ncbi:MAG TPA: polymer-forming cytoskeletal protein [Xanthomonadaceae bacterium]|jgi:cytoskeletal protein CcmA (bactofilin family)|nr:polymer-forming cytoskeletal protein [Xanthomonadaceae bacterium]
MALWNDRNSANKNTAAPASEPVQHKAAETVEPVANHAPARIAQPQAKESLIAANLFIEGKIQGAGDVRIAGQFKGDVDVQGDLTIEVGARLTGQVRAGKVVIAGELDGNVTWAARVDVLNTGVVVGDLRTGSLTVAAGSKMRGQIEVGVEEKVASNTVVNLKASVESGAA